MDSLTGTLEYKGIKRKYLVVQHSLDNAYAQLEPSAMQRLKQSLKRVEVGFAADIVTPILGRNTPDKREARKRLIEELLPEASNTGFRGIDDLEQEQAQSIGPLSITVPWTDRGESLLRYFSVPDRNVFDRAINWVQHNELLSRAFDAVVSKLPHHTLDAVDLDTAFSKMPRKTNLGWPFFSQKEEFYPELLSMARSVEKGYNAVLHSYPAVLYTRTQSQGLDLLPKARNVWGLSHIVILHELRLQIPLLDVLRKIPAFAAIVDQSSVNEVVSDMLSRNTVKNCIDYSQFDALANKQLIRMFFDVLRYCFKPKYKRLIDYVEYQFLFVPILNPDGEWHGEHGIPSGSGLTNQAGSVIQWIKAEYFAKKYHTYLVGALFQGDDGVWEYKDNVPFSKIHGVSKSLFGMVINTDKGGISKESVRFIQNIHIREYSVEGVNVGVRAIMRAIEGVTSLERPRGKDWRPVDTTLQFIQQIENCRYHPHFSELVRYVFNRDNMMRDFNIREIVAKAGGLSDLEARDKARGFPFGKYPLAGIYSFATVKEIEKLRAEMGSTSPLVT